MSDYYFKIPHQVHQSSYLLNKMNNSFHKALESANNNDLITLDFIDTTWFEAELTVILSSYIEMFKEKI